MRQVFAVLSVLVVAAAAQAQVGPAPARIVSKPMPSKAPAGQTFRAEARLVLTRKGRVYSTEIVTGSGDAAFDKQWPKSLEDWRFVPAVGGDGEPIESTVFVTYSNTGVAMRAASSGGGAEAVAPNVINESERLAQLTCEDFLWEYEIVTDALPRRLALLDPLLKTPLTMFAAESQATPAQLTSLRERYSDIVSDAAGKCGDTPAELFWTGVLKPAMQAALVQ